MKKIYGVFLTLIILAQCTYHASAQEGGYSQEKLFQIDSLKKIINSEVDDSIKVDCLVEYDYLIDDHDGRLSLKINKQIDSISMLHLTNFKGTEREFYFLSKIQYSNSSFGTLYEDFGNFDKAIEYNILNAKIAEETDDLKLLAQAYNQLGNIYDEIEDWDKAYEYYNKCLKISMTTQDTLGMFMSHGNIANYYKSRGDLERAESEYRRGLELELIVDHKYGLSVSYNQLGKLYIIKGDLDSAEVFLKLSYDLKMETDNQISAAQTLLNMGEVAYLRKNYDEAIHHSTRALNIAQAYNSFHIEIDAANKLYAAYKRKGDLQNAIYYLEFYHDGKDSVLNFENQNEVIKQGFAFEYAAEKLTDSLAFINKQSLRDLSHEQDIQKEKQQQTYLYAGLAIALLFGIFAYNRFKQTRKQKQIIESQKVIVDHAFEELEEKNQEIIDSIAYAKRIQSAILPPAKLIQELLPDSFVLYMPKDIVAGDFYWIEQKEETVYFAAADCTGHGVPGAMVSVICNSALNRSLREFDQSDPNLILDRTREIVIREFEKSEEDVKDGMDIALCSLKDNQLHFSGANNPLWIIRNGEIIEIKGDKQPIGKFDAHKPFTKHSIDLIKGDTIYLFSDGYVDQFGGEKGKKFKAKNFKELLLSIQDKTHSEQKNILQNSITEWMGNLEQIDDICVLGVKV